MRLKPAVLAGLARHGIAPLAGEAPEVLRERLNDAYLEAVRRLKQRQRSGEIPLREYAAHVEELRESYPLLSLPLDRWVE